MRTPTGSPAATSTRARTCGRAQASWWPAPISWCISKPEPTRHNPVTLRASASTPHDGVDSFPLPRQMGSPMHQADTHGALHRTLLAVLGALLLTATVVTPTAVPTAAAFSPDGLPVECRQVPPAATRRARRRESP